MATEVGGNLIEDSVVFGYDTNFGVADNNTATRFYQGKPSTPLRGTFPSGTTLPSGYVWTYEYDNVVVDAPITNHFLSNQKWVRSTRDTTGSTRVMFLNNSFTSGVTYTWSCYVYCIDPNLTSLAMVSHNGSYSAHQGGVTYTNSDIGTVKRIHGTWIQQQNGSSIYGMQTNSASIGTQFFMTGFQVEQSNIETPLTSTTRSSTQSLIDLKRTADTDVSNVSFDSTGQPEFDGSNDYVDLGSDVAISPINQGWTAEYVFNTDSASTLQHFNGCEESVHNAGWLALLSSKLAVWDRSANVWKYGSTQFASNTWYHIAFIQESGTSMQFYVNGIAEGGDHASFSWTASKSAFFARYVGKYAHPANNYSRYFNGHIPIAKLYNAPLTAAEIKQNYNAYKNRFNI